MRVARRSTVRLALCSLLWPLGALAQEDAARADGLFERAVALMKQGDFAEACPLIEESQRVDPRLGSLFTLADCLANTGKVGSALLRYEDFLRTVAQLPPSQQIRQRERVRAAEEQRRRLLPLAPTLTLVLSSGSPATTEVRLDDVVVPPESLGIARPVDPGEHVVTTVVPGGRVRRDSLTLTTGQRTRVLVAVDAAPPPPPPPHPLVVPVVPPPTLTLHLQPRLPPSRPWRTAAYVTGGVGLAGFVTGAVAGVLTLHQASVVRDNCVDLACTPTGQDAVHQGRTLGTLSTVAFGVGILALGASATLFAVDAARKPSSSSKNAARRPLIPRIGVAAQGAFAGVAGAW